MNEYQWLRRRRVVAAAAAMALSLTACADSVAEGDAVTLDQARADLEAGRAVVIDIREREEHATGVAAGALLLPMSQIARRLSEIPAQPDKPVFLICNTQNRLRSTLKALRERGYTHVRFVQGGMSEWARRGWPMVPPGPAAPGGR